MITNIRDETFKERDQYPHLEDIVVGKRYAFTLHPHAQLRSLTETYMTHMDILLKNVKNCELVLRPEISTKTTRLHYHGTIVFKSSVALGAFYFHTIPLIKEHATFVIKPVQDYEWYLYCIKQRHIMKPYFNHIKLPYKIHIK